TKPQTRPFPPLLKAVALRVRHRHILVKHFIEIILGFTQNVNCEPPQEVCPSSLSAGDIAGLLPASFLAIVMTNYKKHKKPQTIIFKENFFLDNPLTFVSTFFILIFRKTSTILST
ncbi:MAG: hypothetical protein ACKO57_07420, partial [Alphaproteobacteria bacterium]